MRLRQRKFQTPPGAVRGEGAGGEKASAPSANPGEGDRAARGGQGGGGDKGFAARRQGGRPGGGPFRRGGPPAERGGALGSGRRSVPRRHPAGAGAKALPL